MPDAYCDLCHKRSWVTEKKTEYYYCTTCREKAKREGKILL